MFLKKNLMEWCSWLQITKCSFPLKTWSHWVFKCPVWPAMARLLRRFPGPAWLMGWGESNIWKHRDTWAMDGHGVSNNSPWNPMVTSWIRLEKASFQLDDPWWTLGQNMPKSRVVFTFSEEIRSCPICAVPSAPTGPIRVALAWCFQCERKGCELAMWHHGTLGIVFLLWSIEDVYYWVATFVDTQLTIFGGCCWCPQLGPSMLSAAARSGSGGFKHVNICPFLFGVGPLYPSLLTSQSHDLAN